MGSLHQFRSVLLRDRRITDDEVDVIRDYIHQDGRLDLDDVKLLVEVETSVRLAAYQPGRIEFTPTDSAPRDLAQRLGTRLQLWTGNRWAVTIVGDSSAKTIAEVRDAKENALKSQAENHPLMQAVMASFPGAKILSIRTPEEIAAAAVSEALPEVEDEWDPFEDD